MWRWLKRWVGLLIAWGGAAGCLVTFARWHCWQSRHQAATWVDRQGQTKQLAIRRLVALMPGWAKL
jgi:hypothetical protein